MVTVIVLVAVIGILLLLGYVVYRIDPKRFRLTIEGGWKRITLSVEADSVPATGAEALPDQRHRALHDGERAARKELPVSEVMALPEGTNDTKRTSR
jgi:hypothetical protein